MRLLPWRPGGWTVHDLHLLPRGDGCKYELVDGALWVQPPPPPEHARIIANLAAALSDAAASTDLQVLSWTPSPSPALAELEPDLDDQTTWVGVGEPSPDDGWHVEHVAAVPAHVWLEMVDGSIHLLPEPSAEHQRVVRALAATLADVALHVLTQRDVVLDGRTRVRPDLVVVDRADAEPVADAASLVVEVSDEWSRLVDESLRPVLWRDAGLAHFWRLDLDPLVLITHVLDGDAYRETGRFDDGVVVDAPVRLRFPLADLIA